MSNSNIKPNGNLFEFLRIFYIGFATNILKKLCASASLRLCVKKSVSVLEFFGDGQDLLWGEHHIEHLEFADAAIEAVGAAVV